MKSLNRREILHGCGLGVASIVMPWLRVEVLGAQGEVPEIEIQSVYPRGQWFFNPTGLYVQKGQTVRWTAGKWGATVTAFHPSNDNHELRIPESAKPFDSGIIGEDSPKYNTFEWTFDVEGTYDYFSRNHEPLGMVGRIVVGAPGGPAEKYQPGYGGRDGRAPMFAAQAALLKAVTSADIVAKKTIAYPRDVVGRRYPYSGTR
jgi:plastocyanin